MDIQINNKKYFIILWVLSILGCWSILPYMHYMGMLPSTISIWKVSILTAAQSSFLFGCICLISYKLLPKTDLKPFPNLTRQCYLNQVVYPGLIAGVVTGFTIFLLDKTVFSSSLLSELQRPPFWAGALASIYGAVNEEVLLRLFLFTLIYFIVGKCLTLDQKNRLTILWCVNICVALLFGIGHLPAAYKLGSQSAFETFRILLLNGIGGIVFGWLYWTRGIWTAITAHFVTDIILHISF